MKAINLTTRPVELAPVNGAGLLRSAADPDGFERELAEVTDHERSLEVAGTIALVDAAGRRRRGQRTEPGGDDE